MVDGVYFGIVTQYIGLSQAFTTFSIIISLIRDRERNLAVEITNFTKLLSQNAANFLPALPS
jgi:hypothetical protein